MGNWNVRRAVRIPLLLLRRLLLNVAVGIVDFSGGIPFTLVIGSLGGGENGARRGCAMVVVES